MSQKIIIICGPTASGKTKVGTELALEFGGEIISADSGQVWRGFDIGTAKSSLGEQKILHHLIDVAEPSEHFDAAKFVKLADAAIEDISRRGKIPFVVGGTGMYLRMLVHGLCDAPPRDPEFRAGLEKEIEECGAGKLHERLKSIDPESAEKISAGDRTRLIRALEIFHLTGVRASELRKGHEFGEKRYDALKIGLNVERAELYKRIDERVESMLEAGLLEEARALLKKHNENCQPFAAVGYRELADHLAGRIDIGEAVRLIKRNTRRYAKRQMTWFKADKEIRWFALEEVGEMKKWISEFQTTLLSLREASVTKQSREDH